MTVHTAAVALLLLLAGPALAQPPCPAGSTCGGLGAVIGAAPPLPVPAQATDAVPVVRAGHTYSAPPAAIGPQVANTASLRAASTATYPNGVIRWTDGVAGAPPLPYSKDTAGVCSADDGGHCVAAAGGGYWLAQFSGPADVREWGAVGNGVTDATAAIQAAGNYVSSIGGTLILSAGQLFKITSTLTFPSQIHIQQLSGPPDGNNTTTCPNGGITDTTNTDVLILNGTGSTINGVCFVLGTSGSPATGGRAITSGGTATTKAANMFVTNNTIYYPYIGIDIGGPTSIASGTSTGTTTVSGNIVINPQSIGIAVGRFSSSSLTADNTITHNTVNCGETGIATAVAIFDGAITRFAGNQILACYINTAIEPGTGAGARGQQVLGNFSGVIGDSAILHNLLINATTTLGTVRDLTFSNWWVGANTDGTGSSILIQNSGAAGFIPQHIVFTGGTTHGSNQSQYIFDLENNVTDITVVGNTIGADIVGTGDTGLCDNTTGTNIIWSSNDMSNRGVGTNLAAAVNIGASAGGGVTIIGNNFATATTPMIYSPTSSSFIMDESDNWPLYSEVQTVADAASISVGLYDNIVISGTGTTIGSMGPVWAGRKVTIIPSNAAGITLGTGGTNPFCFAATSLAQGVSHTYTWISGNCWM